MSHHICEIVIPPTDNIEASISQVMDYFKDDGDAEWYDWYVIGGRFSGHKIECSLDQRQLEKFNVALIERKITVSSFQCGKQELQPSSQIPIVDELWREMFPGKGDKCILFSHSSNQYGSGIYAWDVCEVSALPALLTCERLIVAGPHWDTEKHPSAIKPKRMLVTEFWNRVEHQKTNFGGYVKSAIDDIRSAEKHKAVDIQQNWVVVTVDYHN